MERKLPNGNPDVTEMFWLGLGDSKSFKERTERELGNGQLEMERSENKGTTMYKDRLLSPSSSHLPSIYLYSSALVFLFSVVYRERKSGELGA